jgi:hypothetical protein
MIYYVITDMGLISINNIDIHPRPAVFHHSYCPGQQGFTIHIAQASRVSPFRLSNSTPAQGEVYNIM